MGALDVTLKHVSPRRFALAGRPAGTALAALWYLGRREVDEAVIEQVRRKLSVEEFGALVAASGCVGPSGPCSRCPGPGREAMAFKDGTSLSKVYGAAG